MKASHTPKNQLYPVFLKLQELRLLLIGGGNVALEKLSSLLSNSPATNITLVAPSVREEVRQLIAAHPGCSIIERTFEAPDLEDKDLVICATDDKSLHAAVKRLANEKGILVNVADTPELCDFYLGSIVQKGQLKIAISTNGQSPTAAKRIREVLQEALPEELDQMIENLNKVRNNLNGDFEYKVKRMNEITKTLLQKGNREKDRRWKRIATYSLLAFGFMLIGHFIFSYIPVREIADGTVKWYQTLDVGFPLMVLAGFVAQLVDGALGMGYGVTSATILLSAGVNPAAISGSIHTAEMFASGASGYSHYKFGNVNKKLFKALLIPGVLGAVAGAILLVLMGDKYSNIVRPVIAVYTLILGIKFIINAFREIKPQKKFRHYRLLALTGGFFDSFGGGGWGPIVTSTLINNGRSHKYAVGSVSLTEFFVTLASAFTFFTMIGVSHWQTILGLIIGGLVAAPIAARLAGRLPRKTSFMLLGALVIFWSVKILIKII
ncbi:MAG: TSUP family transporter [Chitinophagaceae bacterium]